MITIPELNKLELALQIRARELARSLAERNQIMIERSADDFDRRLDAADRDSSAQALAGNLRLLRQVEAARDRIRDGTYGACLRCEEDIPLKRLQAIPWAGLCISCQKADERRAFWPRLARAA